MIEPARFNLRVQTGGESADNFLTDLYTLAEFCNFSDLRDELIRDRIVVGIRDKVLSERLQLEADLLRFTGGRPWKKQSIWFARRLSKKNKA